VSTKALLIVTALIEAGTGAMLLAAPSLMANVLLGDELTTSQSLVVARIAGLALISISIGCWLVRNGDRHAQAGQVAAIMIYNLAVPIVLMHAWIAWSVEGPGLWPASILHAGLAIWCLVCLWRLSP